MQRDFIWRDADNFGYCSILKDTNGYQSQVQNGRLKEDVLDSMTKAQILRARGVPGKGIDKAPGLQKLFNYKSHAAEHAGKKNKERI